MNELSMEENIEMARAFVREDLVSRGMIADFAIHDPVRPKGAEPNPHIHILVTIRPLKEDGTWGIKEKKIPVMDEQGNPILDKNGKQAYRAVSTTGWSSKEMLIYLRKNWAEYQTGICYSTEITCKGILRAKDNPKCENIGCQVVSYQAATGRWKKLQFHSYHPGSAATSFSDGGG